MALMELFALVIVGFLALTLWLQKGAIKGLPEPPGNFVVGHAFSLGRSFHKTFSKWKQMVGPVYQIRILNYRVVVFNDKQSITKVCSMQASTGRPRFGIFLRIFEQCGEGVVNGEGPIQEEQKKFFLRSFKTYGVTKGESEKSALAEMQDLMEEWESLKGAPFDLESCSVAFVFNTTWSILGSKRLDKSQAVYFSQEFKKLTNMDTVWDKLALLAMDFVDKFSRAAQDKLNGAIMLMNLGIVSLAEHQKDRLPGQPRDVVDEILDRMEETNDPTSYFHKDNMKHGFMLHEVMAGTLDTTTNALEWFLLYVIRNPEIMARLLREIDSVLGQQLLPSLADRDRMPYTQACIWEALRIATVLPLALPHKATEDFEYNGAVIPKGTILITNLHCVNHDPEIWDRPDEFDPKRFLTPEGAFDVDVRNRTIPFGIGRRMCIGSSIALDTMFLFVTSVFQKFQLELVGDVNNFVEKFGAINYTPTGLKLKAHVHKRTVNISERNKDF